MTPKDVAQILLNKHWDKKLPINPEVFSKALEINVVKADDLEEKAGYFDADKRTIYVNSTRPYNQQRFAIARELGHYCLGHGSSYRDTTSRDWILRLQETAAQDEKLDRLASDFAGELLMPSSVVRYLVQKEKILSIDELRRRFDVTSLAMAVRLLRLELA